MFEYSLNSIKIVLEKENNNNDKTHLSMDDQLMMTINVFNLGVGG